MLLTRGTEGPGGEGAISRTAASSSSRAGSIRALWYAVALAQPVRLDALGFEAGEHGVEFGGRSAHHLLGSIVDGDGEVGVGRAGVVLGHRLGDA